MKHLLKMLDLSENEILELLDLADQLRRNREVSSYPHDFIPRLFPYTGTTAFASAFGAPVL